VETPASIGRELFHTGRICQFCGVNMDSKYVDLVEFFHSACWQEYRRRGLVYPME
jgi:hypothetical protein